MHTEVLKQALDALVNMSDAVQTNIDYGKGSAVDVWARDSERAIAALRQAIKSAEKQTDDRPAPAARTTITHPPGGRMGYDDYVV